MKNLRAIFGFAVLGFAAALPAQAAFVSITNPDAAYLASTTKIALPGSGPDVTSITDGTLTVGFSDSMAQRQVPGGWGTWSSPPNSESATPAVLRNLDISSLTLALSQDVTTFGLELESNAFGAFDFTAQFFDGLTEIGSITRSVNGNAGARLFAGTSDIAFDRVVISVAGTTGFALAQVRYDLAAQVPEPGTLALVGLAALGLFGARRRQA